MLTNGMVSFEQRGQSYCFYPGVGIGVCVSALVSALTGPGCFKLMMSLVNVSLNFQKLISQICQYFLLKKCEKLLRLSFFQQKISVYLVIKL